MFLSSKQSKRGGELHHAQPILMASPTHCPTQTSRNGLPCCSCPLPGWSSDQEKSFLTQATSSLPLSTGPREHPRSLQV